LCIWSQLGQEVVFEHGGLVHEGSFPPHSGARLFGVSNVQFCVDGKTYKQPPQPCPQASIPSTHRETVHVGDCRCCIICRDSCWWTRRPIKGRGFGASTFRCKPVTLSKLCSSNRSRRNIRATAVELSTLVDPIIADRMTTCSIVGQGGLLNVGQAVPPVHTGSRL
jgi:hypothetical protein